MLEADKNALQTTLVVNALAVRRAELDFYTNNLNAIITSSSILFGCAITAVGQFFSDEKSHIAPRSLFFGGLGASTALEFAVLIIALFAVIMGPGLALRGPEGSMDKAVDGMRTLTWEMVSLFLVGLVMFIGGLCAYCWICPNMEWYIAIVINVCFIGGSLIIVRYVQIVYRKFDFDRDEAIAEGLRAATAGFSAATASTANIQPQPSFGSSSTPSSQPEPKKKKGFFSSK